MNTTSNAGTIAGNVPIEINNVEDLRKLPNWTCFKLERAMDKDGHDIMNDDGTPKMNKLPFDPIAGCMASSNKPTTWRTYDVVKKAVDTGGYSGVGFMFGDCGICGIDLDHCIDAEGNLSEFAADVVARLNSYTEYSPSGRGLHIYVKCSDEGIAESDKDIPGAAEHIEIYRPRRRTPEEIEEMFRRDQTHKKPQFRSPADVGPIAQGRFFTVTGRIYGTVTAIAERTDVIRELREELSKRLMAHGVKTADRYRDKHKAEFARDPREKKGCVGIFCRTYTVTEAIEKFLPDIYEAGARGGRYTYIAGSSTNGVIIYDDDLFAFSMHATDRANTHHLMNAFDLVRVHRFGDLDVIIAEGSDIRPTDYPSYQAMKDFVKCDPECQKTADTERAEAAKQDFLPESEYDPEWRQKLERNPDTLAILPSARNLALILWNDENLRGIRLNRFSGFREVEGNAIPWERHNPCWTNDDDSNLYLYVSQTYQVEPQDKNIRHAFNMVTFRRSFNPLEDYINGLPEWDGIPRVETLLCDYLGAEDTPYTRAVTRKALAAAIRRVKEPGCKFDSVLVLIGPQGIGKSTLLDRLGGEYFSDSLSLQDVKDKTAAEKLAGIWLMEISEMQGMRKTEVEALKGFITRRDDQYRPAYGVHKESHPRVTVLFGTTNSESGFLRDSTGGRRWWPVHVHKAVKSAFNMDKYERDQIWSEAKMFEEAGELLYLDDPSIASEAEQAQAAELEVDPRKGLIEQYLDTLLPSQWNSWTMEQRIEYFRPGDCITLPKESGDLRRMTVSGYEIWCECLQQPYGRISLRDAREIGAMMDTIPGWEATPGKKNTPYGRQRIYRRIWTAGEF